MRSTRAYYSGSRFFPNFVRSIPMHVSLIFCSESALRTDSILKITETTLSETDRSEGPELTSLSKLE